METKSLYELDDIFYKIGKDKIEIWAINNILTSAVGHKVIYELSNLRVESNILTIEEPKLQKMVDKKELVRDIEEVKSFLSERIKELIDTLEETRINFLKEKLNRVLSGTERKAKNNIKSIKEKISKPDNCFEPGWEMVEEEEQEEQEEQEETEEVDDEWYKKEEGI